jgi:hypothetical protein
MYAYILSKLNKESLDEFARHEHYSKIEAERDMLKLWMTIKEMHQTLKTSKAAGVVKKSA